MSTEHILTKKKLQSIPDIKTFDQLLDSCTLTDIDKEILRLHYLKGKSFGYIGDILGYSEETIKKKHKKSLIKLGKIL